MNDESRARVGWLVLLLLAVTVYLMGLGGQYIPTNGDELVYSHIARLTAASGHWLPLVSELPQMRNTKPPLLFWQAMLAGGWGQHWSQFALRLPSLVYTLLTTAALARVTLLITGQRRQALLAACLYLAFFSTFRYGRPYLTSAPETFWFCAPLWLLLWWVQRPGSASAPERVPALGWWAHLLLGLSLGLGLAYKSFALIAPAASALWLALLVAEPRLSASVVLRISLRMAASALVALGVFGLWFVLDPQPQAVWTEFVIGENAGKFASAQGYWHTALYGGDYSIWAQALAYVQNAGLLAFVVLGLGWVGWQGLRQRSALALLPKPQLILLAWLAVWLAVFMLPNQRSARYVIAAMPALAILLALYWQRIARLWFLLSLLLSGLFLLVLSRIGWASHALAQASAPELALAMLPALVGTLGLLAGLARAQWTRATSVLVCLCVYASFNAAVAPLDGATGRYSATTQAALQHARIAVPNGFNGQFERFEFLLPGNQLVPYDADARRTDTAPAPAQQLAQLLQRFDAVIWLQGDAAELVAPCLPGCTVLGERWEVKGRHRSGEITWDNLWWPQLWLFRREWLLQRAP